MFLAIVAFILIVLDVYAYQGLRVATQSKAPWAQRLSRVLFWGLSAIALLSILLFEPMSQHPRSRAILTIGATIGMANLLGKLLFGFWLLLDDFIRLLRWLWQFWQPPVSEGGGIPRSEFLARAGAITALAPLAVFGWGVVSGAHNYRVLRRTIRLPHLPKEFEGYRITQISDIHCGSFWNRSAVERGIAMVNEQKSDAIFFTGDLVNNLSTELDEWKELFGTLRAPDGVFSVLGNHDYADYVAWASPAEKAANLNRLKTMQREMGWQLLINEHKTVERDGARLAFIGVENWGGRGRFPQYGKLDEALAGTENAAVRLLLSHDPSHWRGQVLESPLRVDAQFAGHTHGMQFGIEVGSVKWSPVKYFYPEWADLYEQNGQYLYVNRGFGYIGYPGRFGILPEITVITLSRA